MASTSEIGNTKNVSNFETMLTHCTTFGSLYNPSNHIIALSELTTFYQECRQSLAVVKETEAPFNNIEGIRKLKFKPLKPLSTKVLSALKASGAASTVIDDAITVNRKIQGKRANNEPLPVSDDGQPLDRISVSQQSYDLAIDHFERLIAIANIESNYRPNETELKVSILNQYKYELESINTAVKNAYSPYKSAMIDRDRKLYDPQAGLVARALMVKSYVKSVFGASSPEYKMINKLRFRVKKL